jgi:Capsule polysaccharide biosynthesis protein
VVSASTPMKTIVILSRGARLSALFGRVARELGRTHRIIVVFRVWNEATADDPKDWVGIDNLISYNLRDEMRKRATGDLSARASQIEKEIGLSVYRSASNYLLYRRFSKEYFGAWNGLYDSEQEILHEFVGSHSLMTEIIDRHQPDVMFSETPDVVAHRVAQATAFRRGIFTLGLAFNNLFGDGIVNFTMGCNRRNPLLEYYYRNPEEVSAASWKATDALMARLAVDGVRNAKYIKDYLRDIDHRRYTRNASRFFRRLLSSRNLAEVVAQLKAAVARLLNKRWLDRHLKRELPSAPYVLVLLHYQPEASTCMAASRWVDQDRMIEQLAINAPMGIRIAVKENPRGFGWRGYEYYSRLLDLKNVFLVHPLVSNDALIREAAAILSITGTVGMEGIALGKKVAVLGRPAYDIYEGVRKIDNPEEIFDHLVDPGWTPESMVGERRRFFAAVAESSFFLGGPQRGEPWPLADEAGPNLARALESFLSVIERAQLRADQVSPAL